MITYVCGACGASETARSRTRLDEFWIAVPPTVSAVDARVQTESARV